MAFGVSFLPENNGDENGDLERDRGAQFQKAIQLLQLRLPRRPSFGGLAPAPLLNAPGGMGMGGQPEHSAYAQAFLAMAGMGQPQDAGAPRLPSAPVHMPKIVPGQLPNPSAGTPKIVPGINAGATMVPQGPIQKPGQAPPSFMPEMNPGASDLSSLPQASGGPVFPWKKDPWGGNTFF